MNVHSTSVWKYPPRKRMAPTRLPPPFAWAVLALVIIIALTLAHAVNGAVSEAIHQSITTPKGW